MDRNTYIQITEDFEQLHRILDEISELGRQTEDSWKTEAGKLFSSSFNETLLYIRKILFVFGSELCMAEPEKCDTHESLGGFSF